jgi:hypothetical protein
VFLACSDPGTTFKNLRLLSEATVTEQMLSNKETSVDAAPVFTLFRFRYADFSLNKMLIQFRQYRFRSAVFCTNRTTWQIKTWRRRLIRALKR